MSGHVLTRKPVIIEVKVIFKMGIFNTAVGAADFFDVRGYIFNFKVHEKAQKKNFRVESLIIVDYG